MERFLVEIRVVEVDFFKDVGLMFKKITHSLVQELKFHYLNPLVITQ